MIRPASTLFILLALPALAVDVDPSKTTVPASQRNPGGKRFDIFAGDPKRIQRANAIDFADFTTKIELSPNPLSIEAAQQGPSGRPAIKVTLSVRNNGKRTYTLSFPNSQRYNITIKNASGAILYTWSDDKAFVEGVGTILINSTDIISYTDIIALADFAGEAVPGAYTVEVAISNYPELSARAPLTISP